MSFCVLLHRIQLVYGHIFSKHFHRNLYFKGTKSFTENLDVSKTEVKENICSFILYIYYEYYLELGGRTIILRPKWPIYPN